MRYNVEQHWACTVDVENYEDAFKKALLLFAKDYQIKVEDLSIIRSSLKASIIDA